MSRTSGTTTRPVVAIGAGPCGLPAIAHLRERASRFRVCGSPLPGRDRTVSVRMVLTSVPTTPTPSAPEPGGTRAAPCRTRLAAAPAVQEGQDR
ncbi:hypothetical protein [Streptomyces longispororuber]|uniref:hypothetical protein n=1 Tax=Streptomyces longispororuber TaxID=68230 RepID=UPI002108FDD4|nr:hypothetical protein [Streptomyces longispororuber]MCQ4210899.1 hypothetical protein [Streptomyces longispororuber]